MDCTNRIKEHPVYTTIAASTLIGGCVYVGMRHFLSISSRRSQITASATFVATCLAAVVCTQQGRESPSRPSFLDHDPQLIDSPPDHNPPPQSAAHRQLVEALGADHPMVANWDRQDTQGIELRIHEGQIMLRNGKCTRCIDPSAQEIELWSALIDIRNPENQDKIPEALMTLADSAGWPHPVCRAWALISDDQKREIALTITDTGNVQVLSSSCCPVVQDAGISFDYTLDRQELSQPTDELLSTLRNALANVRTRKRSISSKVVDLSTYFPTMSHRHRNKLLQAFSRLASDDCDRLTLTTPMCCAMASEDHPPCGQLHFRGFDGREYDLSAQDLERPVSELIVRLRQESVLERQLRSLGGAGLRKFNSHILQIWQAIPEALRQEVEISPHRHIMGPTAGFGWIEMRRGSASRTVDPVEVRQDDYHLQVMLEKRLRLLQDEAAQN